jgi:hypothetical protein
MRVVTLSIVLALSTTSAAQPGVTPRTAPAQPAPAAKVPHRSGQLAVAFGTAGTIVGAALLLPTFSDGGDGPARAMIGLGAIAVLPSVGHLYTEDWLWVAIGVGMRVGAGLLVYAGSKDGFTPEGCNRDFDFPCDRKASGQDKIDGGKLVLAISLLVDVVHPFFSAERFNRRHQISVAPTAMIGGGNGLAVGARF